MAKPIFLVLMPPTVSQHMLAMLYDKMGKLLPDYRVLILLGRNEEIKAQVLSEKGGREIDIDALAETVKQVLNDQCS
jgi:hypothetical protein